MGCTSSSTASQKRPVSASTAASSVASEYSRTNRKNAAENDIPVQLPEQPIDTTEPEIVEQVDHSPAGIAPSSIGHAAENTVSIAAVEDMAISTVESATIAMSIEDIGDVEAIEDKDCT